MIEFIIAVSIVFISIFIYPVISDWSNHKSQMKKDYDYYGFANYNKFLEEFSKVDWIYNAEKKKILQSNDYSDFVSRLEISFNNRGMIMSNPISFFMARRHIVKSIDSMHKEEYNVTKWRE